MTDEELMRRYAKDRSEQAMTELVRRHMKMVYSMARRETGDSSMAEDVTQAVFLVLARKAGSISPRSPLPSWLFAVTRFAARDVIRAEIRRRKRETLFVENAREQSTGSSAWDDIEPRLEDALATLPKGERDAVLLRFFSELSLTETGDALGISAEAAQMRVRRGLEKLRSRLAPGITTVVLATILTEHATSSALAMSESTLAHAVQAMITASSPPSMSAPYLIHTGVIRKMSFSSIVKPGLALLVAVLAGSGTFAVIRSHRPSTVSQSTSPSVGGLIKPINIGVYELPIYVTVENQTILVHEQQTWQPDRVVWSTKFRPDLKLDFVVNNGTATLTDDAGTVVWTRTYAAPKLTLMLGTNAPSRLTDAGGNLVWSGSLATIPATNGTQAIASLDGQTGPGLFSRIPTNSGSQNGIPVEEWYSGQTDRLHYRLEHRLGLGHPDGDFATASIQHAGKPAEEQIWSGKGADGGLAISGGAWPTKVMGIADYPAATTMTGECSLHFWKGTASVKDDAGHVVGEEPIVLASKVDMTSPSPTPHPFPAMNNVPRPSSPTDVPDDHLEALAGLGRHRFVITYSIDGKPVSGKRVSLNIVQAPVRKPNGDFYREEDRQVDDLDAAGKVTFSMPSGHYVAN